MTIGRFNPAYAGNITSRLLFFAFAQVQPRVCGEYIECKRISKRVLGSTPRMRGILYLHLAELPILRFNPAYAGNIVFLSNAIDRTQVQPRVCGEYFDGSGAMWCTEGSTPRMRGILSDRGFGNIRYRFNPAYAGNIPRYYPLMLRCQVQPRVCGEYFYT